MKQIYPITITDKLKECSEFYVQYFDFTVVFESNWYLHLVHEESGTQVAFMAPNTDNQPEELHREFSGAGIVYSFEVDDAQSEYEKLADEPDLNFIVKLKDEEFGQRHFIVSDPSGVYIDVVQQLQ